MQSAYSTLYNLKTNLGPNLSSIGIPGDLRPWSSVQIDDDVEAMWMSASSDVCLPDNVPVDERFQDLPSIAGPSTDLFQILQASLREMLAIGKHEVFAHPIAHWDSDSVDTI